MKETRRSGIDKVNSLWKNLTTGIFNRINKKDNTLNIKEDRSRDMGDTHTPISRLDLTGMNREQAKEQINKLIDEKLERVSHIELSELEIDYKERERQRAKAAERITERRNRRKRQIDIATETVVTEHGVYSDFKHSSVFDEIQPELFPAEELHPAPMEGQLSILDAIETSDEPERDSSFDVFGLWQHNPDHENIIHDALAPEDAGKPEASEGIQISTAMDEAVDKIFALYDKNRAAAQRLWKTAGCKTGDFLKDRVVPAAVMIKESTANKILPLLQKAETALELKAKKAAMLTAFAEHEKRASDQTALFIDFIDKKNEAFLHCMVLIQERACSCITRIREFAEHHKKKLLIGFGAGVAAAAAITIVIGNMTAYEYIYSGKVLGVVRNQEDVYKTIDIIGDKLSAQYDADITIDKEKDIRFHKIIAFNQDVDGKEDVLNRLTYMRDMKANGQGIYVDGRLVAVLESEKTAKGILEQIKTVYLRTDSGIEYTKVGFAEDVVIRDVETKLGDIEPRDKALEYMMTGAVEKKIHVVQSGETFSEIAKMYGLKQSELKASNPDVIPEKLSIGQEICLNQIVPLVTVQTTEIAQYKEAIPYEIEYENTGSLFKNEQIVKSKGTNGEKDVVAEIVRNNGIEVNRKELSSTVLSEPVSQKVLVGTKEPPPLIGTGTFIYPIRGTLTSRYGMRWGRLHAGIDLAAPIGTRIKAADGGKVTFAGYNGALGYMVAIDHGGGRETWYGHCSKLYVKKGDRVYQGQHIANVGNTGRSTGPHVHFEVHINGKTKNPLNYL